MPKKKTRAQQLAKLFAQPEDVDIENADVYEDGTLATAGSSDEEELYDEKKPSKQVPERRGRLLRSVDISTETGAYKGHTIRREDLFADTSELRDLMDDDEGDMSLMKGEVEEYEKFMEKQKEDEEEEEDDEGEIALQNHLNQLELENQKFLENIQKEREKEVKKAKSVFNQKVLYDNLLKLRVLAHKPLMISNRLPQGEMMDEFCKQDDKIDKAMKEIHSMLSDTLHMLFELQSVLWENNPKFKRTQNNEESNEHDDPLWEKINNRYQSYSQHRNKSLEEWNRRTRLGLNIQSKNFKSINTSLTHQMKLATKDVDRWIERSQIKRFPQHILGKHKREEENLPPAKAAKVEEEETDPEIFDDREFYQTLLKELIQDVGADIIGKEGYSLEDALSKTARRSNKKKGYVRQKAKGKTLRYNVHPKLVGFMAPQEKELPESATLLFANMFGGMPEKFKNAVTKITEEPTAESKP